MHSFRALILALAASFAAPAFAQDEAMADITGFWTFETGPYNNACTIRGRMFIHPRDAAGQRACEFTAFETCPHLSAEVRQACQVAQDGDKVVISSRIVSIEDQQPGAYGYAPDNWSLVIRSEKEMTGTLESASRATAVFRRENLPVS